jgi:hypothetical protein
MRLRAICVLALAIAVLAPTAGAAAAAPPVRWPSAADVLAREPGIGAGNAACMARFLRGRLARSAWLAPYRTRTPAGKLTSDRAHRRCLTRAERIAMVELGFTRALGQHRELRCVARRVEARSRAVRLAITTRLQEFQLYDRAFRACGYMRVFYRTLGEQFLLEPTRAERGCLNRRGSVVFVYPLRPGLTATTTFRAAFAAVYDRCIGNASRDAMWLRLARRGDVRPARAAPCVARRVAHSATFVEFLTDANGMARLAKQAARACGASAPA